MQNINKQLSELSSTLSDAPIDMFICSASFEDRCKSITDSLGGLQIERSIVAYNQNFQTLVQKNLTYLSEKLIDRTTPDRFFKVALDTSKPIWTADHIAREVEAAVQAGAHRFVIDATTFTRESLLILVRFLKQSLKASDSVQFLYAPAKEYSIGAEYEDKWLSKGIREVRSVLGYPGDFLPSRRTHLIILVGFEDERAISLIRECEPALISLGLGDNAEAGTGPHQSTNEHRFARLKSSLDSASDFVFKGYDAEATRKILTKRVSAAPDLNTIIAPMNTKISTLAAAALALENESIQICYAQASIYNYSRYSSPDDNFYLFRLAGLP